MRWETDDAWRAKLPWYSLCDDGNVVDIRVIQRVEEEIRLIYEGDGAIDFVICYSNDIQVQDCTNPEIDTIKDTGSGSLETYDYCMSSCLPFAESYGIHRTWYCKAHCQNVMNKYKEVAHIDVVNVSLNDSEDIKKKPQEG